MVTEGQTFYPFDYTKYSTVISDVNMVQNIVILMTRLISMNFINLHILGYHPKYDNLKFLDINLYMKIQNIPGIQPK